MVLGSMRTVVWGEGVELGSMRTRVGVRGGTRKHEDNSGVVPL